MVDDVGHRGMSSCYKLLAIWLRTNPSVSWIITCVQSKCFESSTSIIKLMHFKFKMFPECFSLSWLSIPSFLRPPLKATWSMTTSAPGCRVEECVSLVQPTGFYEQPDPRRQARLPTSCLYWGCLTRVTCTQGHLRSPKITWGYLGLH